MSEEQYSSPVSKAQPPEETQSNVQEASIPVSSNSFAGQQLSDVRTLLSWSAPGRPFRKRGKEYFINILIITLAVQVILFLFSQWMLMVLAASLVFLTFALATVPPLPFHYKISTEGVTIEDHFYLWQELYDFYFKMQEGTDTMIIRTKAYVPGELAITLGSVHREQARNALIPYLAFREYVKPSFLERAGEWLSKTFPLEKRVAPTHEQSS